MTSTAGRDKEDHIFSKDISPKVNVIEEVEFEIAYYDVLVKYVNHYTTGTFPGKVVPF